VGRYGRRTVFVVVEPKAASGVKERHRDTVDDGVGEVSGRGGRSKRNRTHDCGNISVIELISRKNNLRYFSQMGSFNNHIILDD